ncbi:MAG: hypothetical protein WD876_02550 [Candidatus Pacearchaeota archaeon]
MNPIKILNSKEHGEIEKQLKEQFGINQIQGKIIKWGTERLLLFSGSLSEKEIENLEQDKVPIEKIGFYFAKIIKDELKLTIEGTQALSPQITKNIYDLNSSQAEEWMMGRELQIKTGLYGFIVMRHGNDLLGCGKASQEKITNFIPKPRRLKSRQ